MNTPIFKTTILGLCLALMFSSCSPIQKEQKNKKPDDLTEQKFIAKDLKNQPLDYVLAEKYTKAALVCTLWSQAGQVIDTSLPANDQNTINIKMTQSGSATLTLSSNISGGLHAVNTKLTINTVHIFEQIKTRDLSGLGYLIQFTPVIRASAEYSGYNLFSNGNDKPLLFKGKIPDIRVFEKIRIIALDSKVKPAANDRELVGSADGYSDLIQCELKTEVLSPYLDQFKIIKETN